MVNDKVQMVTIVDSHTGMVMYVETKDAKIDMRPYGATCDYDGMEWDFD